MSNASAFLPFLHIMVMILLLSQHIFYSGFYLYFCIAIVCSVKLAWEPEEPVRSCIICTGS